MSHVSGRSIEALFALTECKATDDAVICIDFEGIGNPVPVMFEEEPLTLGHLRELAAAFGAWL